MRIVAVLVMAAAVMGCVTIVPAEPGPTFELPASFIPPDETLPVEPTLAPEPTQIPVPVTTPRPATPTPEPDPDATPRPSVVDLLPILSSEMTVVNLADSPVSLTVAIRDPNDESETPSEYLVGTFDIAPLQVSTQATVPARLRLAFSVGASDIGTCMIDLAEGEAIQFAVVESGIAVTSSTGEPDDPSEMLVETASRCHAGEAT